jgi:hypothetical protein
MAAVLKTAVVMSHRGFESLSLRQSLFEYEMAVFDPFEAIFEAIAIAEDSRNAVGGFDTIPERGGSGASGQQASAGRRPG